MLDENGGLNFEAFDKHWEGAVSLFHNGQSEKAAGIFEDKLYQIVKNQNIQEFEELIDFDILFRLGVNDFALKCLEVVANICSNDRFTNI